MATRVNRTPAQQHIFRYQSFQIDKSQTLGHGSYGAVYKAKCDELPCAAKVLHPTIVDPSNHDPGAVRIMDRFSQECALLESIRHPNIVQYLAMTFDPESRLPVLLMELLDESLTKMLERSPQSLAYYIQVDICHDVALAIAYLHSNNIIHRDLSSNNVLIIAGRRAKVTDFGMSKLAGAAPTRTPLTMCPGTLAYMPPEALREPPRYTKKLDCFSEGVIMIQVCSRLWPEPGPRTQLVPDTRSPTGKIEMPVLEPERRKNHIDLINPNHALLPIAMECLKYEERERPSSEELCQRPAGLKDSHHYRDNVRQHQDEIQAKDIQITALNQQLLEKDRVIQEVIQEKERVIQDKNRELQEKESVVQEKERALQNKERVIQDEEGVVQEKERMIQDKDRVIQDKERESQYKERAHREEIASRERQLRELNQQLKEQEQVTAEIQHSLQRQVEQLQQQLSQQNPDHKPHPPKEWKVTLNWRDGGKAPFKMSRGAAVVEGGVAYFMHWEGQTCSYNSTDKKWSELPKYPYQHGSLAVVNGQLTAIGGYDTYTNTNKLLTLCESWLRRSWSDVFPPMPTKRRSTTAVTSKEYVIVAGGSTGSNADRINTVEVMDTKTLVWSTVASLPHPYHWASATICGDHLYMLGGWSDKDVTKSVLTCSLTELLQSSSSSSVWHRVADVPAYYSTCAAVNGQLLAFGGCDEGRKATAAIHKYNPTTNSWDHISNMPTASHRCLVAVLPTNEMMAVGGMISDMLNTDKVDIASINISESK